MQRSHVVFSPPEIVRQSVSALLIEERNVWLGLELQGEWGNHPGGLLRYGRYSGWVDQFDVGVQSSDFDEAIILQIKRWRGSLYLATTNGLYILKDNRLTHHVFEPALDGGTDIFKLKSQPLKSL